MVAPINPLTVTANQVITWDASKSDALTGTQRSQASTSLAKTFSNPIGTNLLGNQCIARQISIANAANATEDLSAAVANVLGDATATIVRVKAASIWLPKYTETATLGSNATSITFGAAAANATTIFGLGGNVASLNLAAGEMISWMTPSTGVLLTTLKNLLIVNNDGTNAANVILVLVGTD